MKNIPKITSLIQKHTFQFKTPIKICPDHRNILSLGGKKKKHNTTQRKYNVCRNIWNTRVSKFVSIRFNNITYDANENSIKICGTNLTGKLEKRNWWNLRFWANVLQGTNLLFSHSWHDWHNEVFPFSKPILNLENKRTCIYSSISWWDKKGFHFKLKKKGNFETWRHLSHLLQQRLIGREPQIILSVTTFSQKTHLHSSKNLSIKWETQLFSPEAVGSRTPGILDQKMNTELLNL